MKKLFQFKVLIILVFSTFCIFSCNPDMDSESITNTETAALLQRAESIQLGKEWDDVQNKFSEYTSSIAQNPHDNKSKIQLAQLYIREARVTGEHGHYYNGALDILENALADSKLTEDYKFLALTTKAGVQLSLHYFADALSTGSKAALLNPSNARIHGVLVDANVELGNYERAVQLLDRMIAIKPDIRSYSRVSYLREIHGDVDGSIEAMIMAVKAGFPGNEETAWAMLTLGYIYKQYGKLDNAEKVYNEILSMRPNYPFAVGALGDLQMLKGQEKLAETTFQNAMDIIPEVGFYVSMAQLYKKQGRKAELEEIMKEIMIMLKEDTDSGHNMNLEYADIYLEILEDSDMALSYASKEYEKRPLNIDVNKMMAKVSLKKGDIEKARKFMDVALSTNSQSPELQVIDQALKEES